jgi:lysophospholipase L1-like esterase
MLTVLSLLFTLTGYAFFDSPSDIKSSFDPKTKFMIPADEKWIALVGDSAITGAVTSPEIFATAPNLLSKIIGFALQSERTDILAAYEDYIEPDFFNIQNPVEPLTRVVYSTKEFEAAKAESWSEVRKINLEAKASMRLDVEEYSFGYLVGRYMGISARNIVLTGQDGYRVKSMARQFERVLEVSETLPPIMLVSFNANDMCKEEVITKDVEEHKQGFKANVKAELLKILENSAKPHPSGSHIYILAPINFIELLTSPSILAKEIPFGISGQNQIRCENMRKADLDGYDLKFLKSLQGMCKSVLRTDPSDIVRVNQLRKLYESHIEAWQELIDEFQPLSPQGLHWHFITDTSTMAFGAEDVANDCFHPSIQGHSKLARALIEVIYKH